MVLSFDAPPPEFEAIPDVVAAKRFTDYILQHSEILCHLRMIMIDEGLADPGPVLTELLTNVRAASNPAVTHEMVANHASAIGYLAKWLRRHAEEMDIPRSGMIPDEDTVKRLRSLYRQRCGI